LISFRYRFIRFSVFLLFMRWERIDRINLESVFYKQLFSLGFEIYAEAFEERRTMDDQIKTIEKNERYNFDVVINNGNDTVLGIQGSWNFPEIGVSYIEHMAVRKEFRNQFIGSQMMRNYLYEHLQTDYSVVDIERAEIEQGKNLVNFYLRLGFKMTDFRIFLPSYDNTKLPIESKLMCYSKSGRTMSEAEYEKTWKTFLKQIYNHEYPEYFMRTATSSFP